MSAFFFPFFFSLCFYFLCLFCFLFLIVCLLNANTLLLAAVECKFIFKKNWLDKKKMLKTFRRLVICDWNWTATFHERSFWYPIQSTKKYPFIFFFTIFLASFGSEEEQQNCLYLNLQSFSLLYSVWCFLYKQYAYEFFFLESTCEGLE